MSKFTYCPPILNKRITVRNPRLKPASKVGRYGQETPSTDPWGVLVYASRRDRIPSTEYEENITVHQLITVWTIRKNDDVPVDSDANVLDYEGKIYESLGPPRIMGGPNYGLIQTFWEIFTVRRGVV